MVTCCLVSDGLAKAVRKRRRRGRRLQWREAKARRGCRPGGREGSEKNGEEKRRSCETTSRAAADSTK